jgi:hypothetical protein
VKREKEEIILIIIIIVNPRDRHVTPANGRGHSSKLLENVKIKSRNMRWVGQVTRMGMMRNAHNILVRNPEANILLGRPRHIWEDFIKMDIFPCVGSQMQCLHCFSARYNAVGNSLFQCWAV